MNKTITTLAAAAMTMLSVSASAATTTVFEDNYADYCVKNIEYGSQVESKDITYTDTDLKLDKTSLDAISYKDAFNSNVYVQNASSHGWMLRYKNTTTIGFYNNEGTRYIAIGNLKAGDKIELAVAGTGNDGLTAPASPVNATLADATSTWTLNFSYGSKNRTFDYTVYTLTATEDGVAGVQIAKGTLIGKITVTRDADPSQVTTQTLAGYNNGTASVGSFDVHATAENKVFLSKDTKYNKNSTAVKAMTFASSITVKSDVPTDNYIKITAANGGFKCGDVITFQPFTTMSTANFADASKYANVVIYGGNDTKVSQIYITGATGTDKSDVTDGHEQEGDVKTHTYTLTADCDALYIGRKGNTNISVMTFTVTREGVNVPTTATVKAGTNGYTTYSATSNYTVSGADAYYAKQVNGTTVNLTKIAEGTVIPANEGVIFKAENADDDITVNFTTDEAPALSGNLLKAVTAETTEFAAGTNYVLATEGTETAFYKTNGDAETLKSLAGKCYLNVADATAAKLTIDFGETNGINEVKSAETSLKSQIAYNLAGQRVAPTTKGIVIINGKKYINK